jgi:hypothetical protein
MRRAVPALLLAVMVGCGSQGTGGEADADADTSTEQDTSGDLGPPDVEDEEADAREECDHLTLCEPALRYCNTDLYDCLTSGCEGCQVCFAETRCDGTGECFCSGDGFCHEPCQLDDDCAEGERCRHDDWECCDPGYCPETVSFCMPL